MKRGMILILCILIGFWATADKKKVKKMPEDAQTVPRNPEGEYSLKSLIDGDRLKQGDYSETRITIKDQGLTATVGCNGIYGKLITNGDKIALVKFNMTEKYCEDYDALERRFTETLNKIDSMGFRKGMLDFYIRQTKVMVLKRKEP